MKEKRKRGNKKAAGKNVKDLGIAHRRKNQKQSSLHLIIGVSLLFDLYVNLTVALKLAWHGPSLELSPEILVFQLLGTLCKYECKD